MTKPQDALNDLASFATTAMGAARVASEEVKTAAQARARDVVSGMDLASKDELETVKAIALAALERVEALEAKLNETESTT